MKNSFTSSFIPAALIPALSSLLYNPAAAYNLIIAIEDCCLTGRDCALRFIENYTSAIILKRSDCSHRSRVAIAHAHLCANGRGRFIKRNPVDTHRRELVAQQLFLIADDHAIVRSIYRDDVERALVCYADSATLPNRVAMNAVVSA